MSERNDFGSFMGGLLMGSIVGALAALVLAPQSERNAQASERPVRMAKISDQPRPSRKRDVNSDTGGSRSESTDTNP